MSSPISVASIIPIVPPCVTTATRVPSAWRALQIVEERLYAPLKRVALFLTRQWRLQWIGTPRGERLRKPLLELCACQPLQVTQALFFQPIIQNRREAALLRDDLGGDARSREWAGVHRRKRFFRRDTRGELMRLCDAVRVERRVAVTLHAPFVIPIGFAVTEEKEVH